MAAQQEPSYKAIAARKQAERDARIPSDWRLKTLPPASQTNVLDIPRTCGILTERELQITEIRDATALIKDLQAGLVTSSQVARAFCKRAAIAHQVTNCLTEIFFENALHRAKELDAHFARNSKPVGPLHGLPISLKDTFRVRGYDSTVGISALCFKPAKANSTLVDMLLEAGAILYCKTNIPLTLMALDSHNNIFGRTLNPADRRLTAGGSSGGEGALLAMRGSILGVGTDVGGSIRIPAMCNELYGVKPSHGRVPYAGQEPGGSKPGSEHLGIRASAGPMAHSMRDCELLLRTISDLKAWERDPEVVPLVWTPTQPQRRPLRIGVIRTDGVTRPLPAIERFMSETATRLSRSGGAVEIVELDISSLLGKCQSLVNKLFSIDGGNTMFDLLEATGEPLSPWLQTRLRRKARASHETVRDLHAERNALQTEFLKIWDSKGGYWGSKSSQAGVRLDALIAPVAPHPLPPIDRWNTASYTSSFVLLDYAAGTLPVRQVVEADLVGDLPDIPLTGWDKVNRTLWTDVDRKLYLGTPLCLQVIAPRLHDQQLVEAMTVLDEVLREQGNVAQVKAAKL
ncbi:amidase [Myriangium duriaei CBS 260.36]|uniref:amidase n=1 Tax=Myriangium duriaei CBS 260.36 TaxID=1168546 RepID=A0A9P4MPD8_9PEZI|nr:amidase [Myriangium duriaei CBS 260.36]